MMILRKAVLAVAVLAFVGWVLLMFSLRDPVSIDLAAAQAAQAQTRTIQLSQEQEYRLVRSMSEGILAGLKDAGVVCTVPEKH